MSARIGDYVRAVQAGLSGAGEFANWPSQLSKEREGVFVRDNRNGTIVVRTKYASHHCYGPKDIVVIPDNKLEPSELAFAQEVRQRPASE